MSLREEVERCYDALSRGDPNAFRDLYHPEIELFVPTWVSNEHGIFRGADAVDRWYADNLAEWSGQRWDLVETHENGPNVVFVLHFERAGRFVGVMSFVEGRIVSIVHLGEESST